MKSLPFALAATLCGVLAVPAAAQEIVDSIAFGSCAHEDKPQPIWNEIVDTGADVFLFLGDNIYGDTEDMAVLRAKYGKLAAKPEYQRARQEMTFLATWDDHDFGLNDSGAEYSMREGSQEAFLDFFDVPEDSPRRDREGVYHAETFGPEGKRVQVIMLDTRYHKTQLKRVENRDGYDPYVPTYDVNGTFLGEAQWAWFEEQLRQPADVRIIGSSIQVIPEDHWFEKWSNLPHERARFFGLINETEADGVIIVSGDRHLGEISLYEDALDYPLYEITSSGLTQSRDGFYKLEENRHRLATMSWGDNFGLIEIDWSQEDPLISMQLRDADGEVVFKQDVPLSLLQAGDNSGET